MTALARLRQKLADATCVSPVSDPPQEYEKSRARAQAPREEERERTNYLTTHSISRISGKNLDAKFSTFLEPRTDTTDENRPDHARDAMLRDMTIVVQDLLAEGRKPWQIRRLFGLTFGEIERMRRARATGGAASWEP